MNILGDTLEEITVEKAGIIKKNIPVVIGETNATTAPIFQAKAAAENAPIFFADQLRFANNWEQEPHVLRLEIADHHHTDHLLIDMDLNGIYQVKNCITVLEAVHQLQEKGWTISQEQTKKALAHVKQLTGFKGRWDVIRISPLVVLDVGHNEDGIRQVLSQLSITRYKKLHIVLGMVKDKDISGVISLLPKTAEYYFTRAEIPRAMPEEMLAALAEKEGISGNTFPDVNVALENALQHAEKEDMILVCGSVFLIGELDVSRFHY